MGTHSHYSPISGRPGCLESETVLGAQFLRQSDKSTLMVPRGARLGITQPFGFRRRPLTVDLLSTLHLVWIPLSEMSVGFHTIPFPLAVTFRILVPLPCIFVSA